MNPNALTAIAFASFDMGQGDVVGSGAEGKEQDRWG